MNKRNKSNIEIAKSMGISQNVCIRVIDEATGKVVQEHSSHNSATNSLLFGIGQYLIGNFVPTEGFGLHPGYVTLSNFVPKYISLGTMGLINQKQDSDGLPAGIGDTIPDSSDPEYRHLLEVLASALSDLSSAQAAMEDECPYWPATDACESCQECSTRIAAKKQAVVDAQAAYDQAYDDVLHYSEEKRFTEYIEHRPGYGADGYDQYENNGRKYLGLGYAYTSYDANARYAIGDVMSYLGKVYRCIQATPNPAGPVDLSYWEELDDSLQPSIGTTINLELISPSFPRAEISYRDIVPEYQSEAPRSIDIVYSALISTGALKQFRPEGQDYIFITEAGLWSKKAWNNSSENGLLAGYRIVPPNVKNWDMTVPENRQLLKRSILKVGLNQVVQVVWKIQISSSDVYRNEPEPNA